MLSLDGGGWDLVVELVLGLGHPEIPQSICIVGSFQSLAHGIRILSLQWKSGEQDVSFALAQSFLRAQLRLYFLPL
jgi:hypothetical protein